jgi:hypothetical protein
MVFLSVLFCDKEIQQPNRHQNHFDAASSSKDLQDFSFVSVMMQDPFADALGDDIDTGIDSVMMQDPRSPYGTTVKLVIDCEEPDLDAIEEAAMQCAESSAEAPSAPASSAPQPTVPEASAQDGAKPKKARQPNKRKYAVRKVDPTQQLKTTPVAEANCPEIRCIFVPRKKGGQEAIPLWPQFTAVWKGADFGGTTWLSVSTQSRWVHLMINAITPNCVRDVSQHMFAAARSEFSACMVKARSGTKGVIQDDSQTVTSDSDSDADIPGKIQSAAVVHVDIGGYTVKCLNTRRQILISADKASVKFIRHWLLPLAQKAALSPADKKTSLLVEEPLAETSVGFQFSANPTPNISGKVTWNPTKHAWRVRAMKPHMKIKGSFEVPSHLSGDKYHNAKSLEYRNAVDAWNKCDGSKRCRIRGSTLMLEDHGATSEPNKDKTSGSQPSDWRQVLAIVG